MDRYLRKTRFVPAADGTRIAFHAHQNGDSSSLKRRALLLTNGIGTTENFWRHLVEALGKTYRVFHWDYRGHGQSDVSPTDDYTIRTQADDLIRVTEAVIRETPDGQPPLHIAFSMGVSVLLTAYERRPELVSAMVFLSGAAEAPGSKSFPFHLPGVRAAYLQALKGLTPGVSYAAPVIRAALRSGLPYPVGRALGLLRKRAPREDIQEFMRGLSKMDPRAYWLTLRALMEVDASHVLPSVKVPVLILAAENDWMMPRRQVDALRAGLPHAHFVEVHDAGHAGLVEAGPELAQEIDLFLRGITSPPAAGP